MNRRAARSRTLAWLLLATLAVVVGSSVAVAGQEESRLGGKLRSGNSIVIPADESISGDLYVTGGQIRIDGTVEGDVAAAGGQVQVTGDVGGDLMIGSGTADVSGTVDGDTRIGAGQITVTGSIGEDLAVGAGQVTLASSGTVGEDFVFGSGQTTLDGTVEGDVSGSTGNYRRTGTIGGVEDVRVVRDREPTAGDRILDAAQRFVAILAIAALLLWLFRRSIEGPAATLRRRPWASLGVGLLGMVGFIVLVVVAFVLMILLAIGLGFIRMDDLVGMTVFTTLTAVHGATYLFFLLVGFVAHAVVGLVLGGLVASRSADRGWSSLGLILGVLAVVVLTAIPVVGGWFGFVIAAFGLGAIILEFWPWRRREAATTPAPATVS